MGIIYLPEKFLDNKEKSDIIKVKINVSKM